MSCPAAAAAALQNVGVAAVAVGLHASAAWRNSSPPERD